MPHCLFFHCERVTVVKGKDDRENKGIAFVLFLERDSAHRAIRGFNNKKVRAE
jgi:RNA recognition motif-containing protein